MSERPIEPDSVSTGGGIKVDVLLSLLFLSLVVRADVQNFSPPELLPEVQVKADSPNGSVLAIDSASDPAPELSHLLTELPNLNFNSGSNRPRFFQIRGVGPTSQFERTQVGTLGIFYEGIDLSEEASVLPLLGREFLYLNYGPKSVEWGGKALVGRLDVRSVLDSGEHNHYWKAGVGNHRTANVAGGSLWSSSKLSSLVGFGLSDSDGYFYNQHLEKPTHRRQEGQALLGLSYSMGSWQVREHHLFVHHRNGYDSWNVSPSFKTQSDHPGRDHHQVHGHSIQYEMPKWGLRLHGLTSFTQAQQQESYDEDWGHSSDYNYYSEFERYRSKFHQKISVTTPLNWEAGLHYYTYQEAQIIRSFKEENLRRTSKPSVSSQHLGAWAKKSWQQLGWREHLALRWDRQHLLYEEERASGAGSAEAQIQKIWSPDLNSTFTVARGHRGGGYNLSPDVPQERIYFGPEFLNMIQVSTEGREDFHSWLVRGFYQWQDHQQIRSSVQLDPTDPSSYIYFTESAGSGRSFGLEGSWLRHWNQWQWSGSLGLIESRFRHRELAHAPTWTYSTRVEYAPKPMKLYVQIGGKDSYYHSEDHDFKSPPRHLVDAGVSYLSGSWEFQLWTQNLFDRRYPVRAFHFANEPPDWETKYYSQLGDPRTFGLNVVFTH